LKVLLVNLLAALNFANVFLNKKRLENKKRDQNKKNVKKRFFTSMACAIHTQSFYDAAITGRPSIMPSVP